MGYVECPKGHLYDQDQNASCPYCNGVNNQITFSAPVGGPGKTVAASNPVAADTGKTVAVMQKSFKMEPVVGWFVCIEGPDKGKDFRILAKNNTIGRADNMDICIKGDTSISRENQARVGYDEKHEVFHLIPGEGANNVYIKDEPVYVPTKIEAYEVLEVGETKLLFIPLVGDKFNWKEGLK